VAHALILGTAIGVIDDSMVNGLLWAAVSLLFGFVAAPRLERWAHRLCGPGASIWLAFALGWGLIPGPVAGSAACACLPLLGVPVSALAGALLGLAVGPFVAAAEGLLLAGAIIGCLRLAERVRILLSGGPVAAAALVREFRAGPAAALARYRFWPAAFVGVLARPPWEREIYQYGGGRNALVYFVTGNPGEWLFCMTRYSESLRELEEGDRYLVYGTVYHFEDEGKLFLRECTLVRLG
jgi:hypothetical protein